MADDIDVVTTSKDASWVEQVISMFEVSNGSLTISIDGTPITIPIEQDLISFFTTNKALLVRVGQETFQNFLMLLNEKKDEAAYDLLLAKMNADDMIAKMNADATELQKMNDDWDQFMIQLKTFAETTLEGIGEKVLIALISAAVLPLL